LRHLEQFGGIVEFLADAGQAVDDIFQRFAFTAQVLCALGVVPDGGVFGELYDFG